MSQSANPSADTFDDNFNSFSILFVENPQPMWIFDVETLRFMAVNNAATKLYGYTKDEFKNLTIKEIRPKEELNKLHKALNSHTQPASTLGHFKHKKKDGTIIDVLIHTHEITWQNRSARHVMITDISLQTKAEEALTVSESTLRLLFDTMSQGVIFQGKTGNIVHANDAAAHILGLSKEQLHARSSYAPEWKIIKSDGTPVAGNEHPSMVALETGKPIINQTMGVFNPNTNKYVWVLASAIPQFRTNDPSPYQVCSTFTDITAQKELEDSLQAEITRRKILFDKSIDGIVILDKCLNILEANESFANMLGYTKQELTLLNVKKWDSGLDGDSFFDLVGQTAASELVSTKLQKKDGQTIEVEATWGTLDWEDQHDLFCIFNDVTLQNQAELSLRQSEEKYKFITEAVEDVIWVMDLSTFRFEYVSPSVEKLRGFTVEEVMALSADRALTPKSAQKVKELLSVSIPLFMAGDASKRTNVTEVDQPTKDGKTVPTEVVTTVILDDKGVPKKILGVSRNISYRRETERKKSNAFKLLDLCNHATTPDDLIVNAINHFKTMVGCENVSFVAKHNAHFPQYQAQSNQRITISTNPATSKHCIWETTINGTEPSEVCICFNVINNFETPYVHHRTQNGSVWRDYASTDHSEQLPVCQKNPNIHCVYKQQASILWVPLKSGIHTLGVIQFDDSSPAFFTHEMVDELESMANYAGIALAKLNSEQELANSTLFLQQVIKGANEGIVVVDKESKIKIWNPYLAEITGLSETDAVGQHAHTAFGEFSTLDMQNRVAAALSGTTLDPVEYQITHIHKGEKYLVWDVLTPLFDPSGHINGTISVIRNITDRKKAENLAQTFSRLYATLSQVNQAIARTNNTQQLFQIICDVAVEYGRFNLAWIGKYNANNHTVVTVAHNSVPGVAMPFDVFYLDQPPFDKGLTSSTIKNRSVSFCKNILNDEGMAHWQDTALKGDFHSVAAIPLFQNGQLYGIFSLYATDIDFFNSDQEADLIREMGLDISYALDAISIDEQRQKAVESLNQASERLAMATSAAQIGVWDWDLTTNTLIWDDVMYGIYQLPPSDNKNLMDRWIKLVHPDNKPELEKMVQMAADGIKTGEIEFTVILENGETKHILASWLVTHNEQGKPLRLTGINTDITSRKQAITDRIAREAAEQANKAKSDFLANMSHEIRTPMNAIIGFSDLMHQTLTDPKQREQIESIRSSSKNLLTIINDILDLSKIEAGKMRLENEFIGIHRLLKGIKQMFSEKLSEKDLPLYLQIDDNVPHALLLDETRITQILINLVGNAVKFTHKGKIWVSVSIANPGSSTVDLIIKVGDTGIGIAAEELPLIFDPFYQPNGQIQKKYGGTGLGLAITQRLVELMGGQISVWSEKHQSTEFTIVIPHVSFDNVPVDEWAKTEEFETCQFEKATILVADDNDDNRNLLNDILLQFNITTLHASNGIEAVKMAISELPNLIMMDLRMPEMNGYEASSAIKGNRATSHIPIVAVSASPDVKMSPKNNIVLFDDFVMKPIPIPKLITVLKKYLVHTPNSNETINTETAEDTNLVWTVELGRNLSKLLRTLDSKYLSDYRQALLNPHIEQLEVFGKELILVGQTNGCNYLSAFGKKIAHAAEMGDLELVMPLLNEFPNVVEEIRELQTNAHNINGI